MILLPALIAIQIFAAVAAILLIGKPRTPFTPTTAVFQVVGGSLYVLAYLQLAGKL